MDNVFDDVLRFHDKFGLRIGDFTRPGKCDQHTHDLRDALEKEEWAEWRRDVTRLQELSTRDPSDPEFREAVANLVHQACDVFYVMLGRLVSYGVRPGPFWYAVQSSNMAKDGGGTRGDGKILKPEGWTEPNWVEILDNQVADYAPERAEVLEGTDTVCVAVHCADCGTQYLQTVGEKESECPTCGSLRYVDDSPKTDDSDE